MRAARAAITASMVLWALVLALVLPALADVAVPPLTGRVVDLTGTLSADQIAALDSKLKAFEDRKGSQVAVLIVPTTAPETIEQYSIRVADQWKIGRKKVDDGAILVIAKDDRKLRIEVGYGLEGALTDVTSRRIIDEVIAPHFRNGDFAGGITAGIDRILSVIDGEPLPPPQRTSQYDTTPGFSDIFNPFALIIAVVFGGILRALFGRLFGSLLAGGVAGVAVWFLIGTLSAAGIAAVFAFVITLISDFVLGSGGVGRGGWVGGRGGGWSGGGSGGGFSGGGGSFGGGGASGNW